MKQLIVISSICYCLCFLSCVPEEKNTTTKAPPIPPAATFIMNTTDFVNANGKQGKTANNFIFSATHVAIWNVLTRITLAIPVAAFLASFQHEPQQIGTDWVWDYTVSVGNIAYTASLQGEVKNEEVYWEMRLSKAGHYTDFLWLTGISSLDEQSGSWLLYTSPNDPQQLLNIEWTRINNTAYSIKYTNVLSGADANGSFMEYGLTNEGPYDAFFNIYDIVKDNTIRIEWNQANFAGRVNNLNHFETNDWQCWDANFQNTNCP